MHRSKLLRRRTFSMLLVPDDGSETRHYRVTANHLHIVVVSLALLLAVIVFLTVQYLMKAQDVSAGARLRDENAYLWAQMTAVENRVLEYQAEMGDLVEREKVLRTMAGLSEIASDVRKVGVGGQGFEDHLESPMTLKNEAAWPSLLLADLDQLLRQAKLERKSFQDIETALQTNRNRLERIPTISPAVGYISRGFGSCTDPFTGAASFHEGIDIVNRVGTAVSATAAGKVVESGWRKGYGWVVVLDHGYGYETVYGHLDTIEVAKGQRVTRGETIATLGNSGRSTGPHLHYEVRVDKRAVDPLKHILPEVMVD